MTESEERVQRILLVTRGRWVWDTLKSLLLTSRYLDGGRGGGIDHSPCSPNKLTIPTGGIWRVAALRCRCGDKPRAREKTRLSVTTDASTIKPAPPKFFPEKSSLFFFFTPVRLEIYGALQDSVLSCGFRNVSCNCYHSDLNCKKF